MGQTKSKTLKFPQYPQPPGYPPYYPYPVQPPVGYAPGYHPPVIPPGYGPVMPQPQIPNWQPRPRRKKGRNNRSSTPAGFAPQAVQPPSAARHAQNVQPTPAGMLDNLPPGFIPQSIRPNPPGASATGPVFPPGAISNNIAQGAVPPPLFTPGVPGNVQLTGLPSSEQPTLRRAATPFVVPPVNEDSDEDDEDFDEANDRQGHRRAASEPLTFPPITADDPIASPGVRPNPLPLPPRDVYELSPYKQLLHLPNTMALLTARTTNTTTINPNTNAILTRTGTNPGMAGVGAGVNVIQPQMGKKRKKFFSFRRGRDTPVQPDQPPQSHHQLGNIQFVPIYQNVPQGGTAVASGSTPTAFQNQAGPSSGSGTVRPQVENPVPPTTTPPTPPPHRSPPPDDDESDDDGVMPDDIYRSISPTSHQSHRTSHGPTSQPQSHPSFYRPQSTPSQPQSQSQPYQFPPQSPSEPYLVSPNGTTIEFSHGSLPDFLNHSPHRVMYGNRIYPSAMHLHEAMKFLETKPELSETIRTTENVEDIYPFTARLQVWVRTDWGSVFLEKMEEVLWHKFMQHANLRTMLLKTGNARIVYSDSTDPYWGSGANFGAGSNYPGTNYLGKLLEKVRERLREYGYEAT